MISISTDTTTNCNAGIEARRSRYRNGENAELEGWISSRGGKKDQGMQTAIGKRDVTQKYHQEARDLHSEVNGR